MELGNCNICEQHEYKKEIIDWNKYCNVKLVVAKQDKLTPVQIIDLVKSGNSSDTYGFTEEEGHVSTTEKSETNYTLEEEGETESANLY